jgi:hypothetical protein
MHSPGNARGKAGPAERCFAGVVSRGPFAMLDVDLSDVHRLRRKLELVSRKAIPHAARNGLNFVAFEARKQWQGEIRRSFTLRNQFTERSVRVDKARGTDVRRMEAVTGSVAPWMLRQEEGGVAKAARTYLPIPQNIARRGGSEAKPVRAGARLTRLRFQRGRRPTGGSPRKRNLIALLQAKRQGRKHAILEREAGGYAIYKVMGGKRSIRTRMLYDLSHKAVRTPAEPTLQRALDRTGPKVVHLLKKAIVAQLRRHAFR